MDSNKGVNMSWIISFLVTLALFVFIYGIIMISIKYPKIGMTIAILFVIAIIIFSTFMWHDILN